MTAGSSEREEGKEERGRRRGRGEREEERCRKGGGEREEERWRREGEGEV